MNLRDWKGPRAHFAYTVDIWQSFGSFPDEYGFQNLDECHDLVQRKGKGKEWQIKKWNGTTFVLVEES